MITAGDVEFEQPQPKMWRQGPHAVAMMYGDAAAQAEIARQSEANILHKGLRDLSAIAESYLQSLMQYVRRLAEAEVLTPLNLTNDSFFVHQASLSPEIAAQIINQLQEYYIRSGLYRRFGGALLIGADTQGGHIFKIEYGARVLVDRIGFAAAGAGQWHAESQFMFSRYTADWDFPEALSLVYSAKKRAEVAPGVGAETDIVLIATNPPNVSHFPTGAPLVLKLEEIYQSARQRHDDATSLQHKEVRNFVELLLKQNPTPAEQTPVVPSAADPVQSRPEESKSEP